MTCWTRARVCSETFRLPLRAYETVLRDTPARLAISSMFNPAPHCLAAASDRGESIRVSVVRRLWQRQHGRSSRPPNVAAATARSTTESHLAGLLLAGANRST